LVNSIYIISIDIVHDKGQSSDFVSIARELEAPGTLLDDKTYEFSFSKVDKPYETYSGTGVILRYMVRITINRGFASKIVKEEEFAVNNVEDEPDAQSLIKMEVGIEDCLHIEFEYNKGKYHLKDCVLGKVYFLLVKIKIKFMELQLIRRETIGAGANAQTESDTLVKYEVMDGAPVKGECIPIRLFLKGYDLTPSYKNVNNKFSVRYFLNLVLVDEEDRRYFKQQEVTFWRKKL
jgi:vacuolar protein sorting-associated protein 26